MSLTWTTEQVLALAPDAASAKAGKDLATPRKWVTPGRGGNAAWGECQGSGKSPYQAQIDLGEPAFHCTCPSRKFPCRHSLGLFLLLAAQPDAFAEGSGLLLLHDEGLWGVLDEWLTGMPGEAFAAVLPLLRRTFATFASPERRQMGERVRRGAAASGLHAAAADAGFDPARAEAVLPLVARILGIEVPSAGTPGEAAPAGGS